MMGCSLRPHAMWLGALLAVVVVSPIKGATSPTSSSKPHSRQKRLLWLTSDGRLALPPGTTMVITPSLSLPFVRYPPNGFQSNLSVALPFTINFDKLGLTDNENPYGVLPPILGRSFGHSAGSLVADYVANLINNRKGRSIMETAPPTHANFHGGERALLFAAVEDFLTNFGLDGKACLLRAICEVHGVPMERFGLLGELLRLFLSASKSPFAEILKEYVDAEKSGGDDGECWQYFKNCPKSLFMRNDAFKYKNGGAFHEGGEEEMDFERKEGWNRDDTDFARSVKVPSEKLNEIFS